MAGFNLDNLTEVLNETEGTGVSFVSKAKNWGSEADAKDLIEAIDNCKCLQYLDLEGNTLGVDAARGIAEALKKHPEFKRALFKDLFTGRLKTEIPKALDFLGKGMIAAGAQLTVLDCSDNALGPNGMTGLVELLKSSTCFSLQELKLNNCGLGIGGGKMLAQALTDCHTASMDAGTPLKLRVFIAGRNRLENEGAKALAQVFGRIKTLQEITMPQNGIYHVGIAALSDAFKENHDMKVLNLNDNTIGPKGAEHIAEALDSMQQLEEINFGDCLLKTKGAVLLGEALQDGHLCLEVINLGFNEIGPNGGLTLASAMFNKESLQKLNLNGNQFGEEARTQIKEILEEGNRLNTLDELDEDDSEGEEDETDEEDGEDEGEEEEEVYGDEATNNNFSGGDFINNNQSLNTTADNSFDQYNSSLSFNMSNVSDDSSADRTDNSITGFFNTAQPSAKQFAMLEGNDKTSAFRNYLKTIPEKDHLIHLVFVILKCSAISLQNNDALNVAVALYKDCYDHAQKTNQLSRVNNFFLMQLGLLKNEDKSFKPAYDLNACRYALKTAIKLKHLPDESANMFNLFLEKF